MELQLLLPPPGAAAPCPQGSAPLSVAAELWLQRCRPLQSSEERNQLASRCRPPLLSRL